MKFDLKGKLPNGIEHIAFSPTGAVVVAVAIDDSHSIAAYNTESGAFLGMNKGDTAKILELSMKNDNEFVSVGFKHYMEWSI